MYPAVLEHRIAYDIDGTEVGYRYMSDVSLSTIFGNGVSSWLDSQSKQNLNREDRAQEWGKYDNDPGLAFWFFFPELREINKMGVQYPASGISNPTERLIQGSVDTTNGMDGTWETAVYSYPTPTADLDNWRDSMFTISFSGPVKALRFGIRHSSAAEIIKVCGIHIYGRKAAGEQVDDVAFCDSLGNELTSLIDWEDRPEGTTQIRSIKIKNASTSKIANGVNLQLNHSDFTMAWSPDGPWQSVLDIASIGPGSLSSTVYIRNALLPPLLALGPKSARIIATVGSWA
ncbi:hypothetical protein EAL2_c19510 [Peptoclostridium acidaminophilum DSM 3953]|uniref:Uncharacterized protein n=1 Tax=Peptoclostridium acidaminophilum DSM 3953 TaxID=1286171 RepID=W8TM18_PEPAC|nr:hypothetical protein [Peptoclostridium acidaminophilum]AHM57232.1 hypothetical protein EAL2_c19510 [Peptoclostridium acidaminophilum DSM 3953]